MKWSWRPDSCSQASTTTTQTGLQAAAHICTSFPLISPKSPVYSYLLHQPESLLLPQTAALLDSVLRRSSFLRTATMGCSCSSREEPKKEIVFASDASKNEVFRIPALVYHKQKEKLFAFAEKRTTADDTSSVALVMKTGDVKKDQDSVTVEVMIYNRVVKTHFSLHGYPSFFGFSKKVLFFFVKKSQISRNLLLLS